MTESSERSAGDVFRDLPPRFRGLDVVPGSEDEAALRRHFERWLRASGVDPVRELGSDAPYWSEVVESQWQALLRIMRLPGSLEAS